MLYKNHAFWWFIMIVGDGSFYYWASQQGKHVAFMHAEEKNDLCIEIFQLVVDGEYKRQGIGSKLVNHVTKLHPNSTFTVESIGTVEANQFWESVGFTPAQSYEYLVVYTMET